jgi:hypothetical protein
MNRATSPAMLRPKHGLGIRATGCLLLAALPAAAALACLSASLARAQQADTPAGIIAAQIRTQGYACTDPVAATRDQRASRPNVTVWTLHCQNAAYRVLLVPDMAAQVTQLK